MTNDPSKAHGGEGSEEHHPTIDFTVDTEPLTTVSKTLTAVDILREAGMNPDERYLIELHGKEQTSYKDDPNKPIHMHEHAVFITAAIGPKTVS